MQVLWSKKEAGLWSLITEILYLSFILRTELMVFPPQLSSPEEFIWRGMLRDSHQTPQKGDWPQDENTLRMHQTAQNHVWKTPPSLLTEGCRSASAYRRMFSCGCFCCGVLFFFFKWRSSSSSALLWVSKQFSKTWLINLLRTQFGYVFTSLTKDSSVPSFSNFNAGSIGSSNPWNRKGLWIAGVQNTIYFSNLEYW